MPGRHIACSPSARASKQLVERGKPKVNQQGQFQGGQCVEKKDVRILVVDDEPMMADSLKKNLVEEGYSVDTAATGAEAIELFDQGGHHLAICDLQLPDMDGLEVMRHMKDARPLTEVIVVTGHATVAKAVEATRAGAFDFVEKTFRI